MKEIIMDGEGLEQYLNDPEITMRIARVTDFLEANGIDFELYRHPPLPVSYTHLTLPTSLEV